MTCIVRRRPTSRPQRSAARFTLFGLELTVASGCSESANSVQSAQPGTSPSPTTVASSSTVDPAALTWELSLKASDGAAYSATLELGTVQRIAQATPNAQEPSSVCPSDPQRDVAISGQITLVNNSTFAENPEVAFGLANGDTTQPRVMASEAALNENRNALGFSATQDLLADVVYSAPNA